MRLDSHDNARAINARAAALTSKAKDDRAVYERTCNFYFFDGWIGVAPTVLGLAQQLARRGYEVIIYCRRTHYAGPGDLGPGIRIRYVERFSFAKKLLPALSYAIDLLRFLWVARPKSKTSAPPLHIGIDRIGAIVALLASFRDKGPILHLSLELDEMQERVGVVGLLNRLFRSSYGRSICCIIQDSDRFDALSRSMGFIHSEPFFVPNAPSSEFFTLGEAPNFFRQILSLSSEEFPHLVVHAGMIEDAVYSLEVAEAFDSIDLGCALIFHERAARDANDPYLVRMRQRNRRNLFFSLNPVQYRDLDRVYSAATIGLALYRPLDSNFSLIAKASGKVSFHLKHGTPMVMNDLPSLVTLNEEYEFGAIVHDPADPNEMAAAIRYCLDNYSRLAANARRCFEQEFSLESRTAAFLDFIAARYPP